MNVFRLTILVSSIAVSNDLSFWYVKITRIRGLKGNSQQVMRERHLQGWCLQVMLPMPGFSEPEASQLIWFP